MESLIKPSVIAASPEVYTVGPFAGQTGLWVGLPVQGSWR